MPAYQRMPVSCETSAHSLVLNVSALPTTMLIKVCIESQGYKGSPTSSHPFCKNIWCLKLETIRMLVFNGCACSKFFIYLLQISDAFHKSSFFSLCNSSVQRWPNTAFADCFGICSSSAMPTRINIHLAQCFLNFANTPNPYVIFQAFAEPHFYPI